VAVSMLVALSAWSLGGAENVAPTRLALLLVGVALAVVAIRVWGARSAWSWIVAALSYEALSGVRIAVYGPEAKARAAGVLTLIGAAALIVLIVRRGERHPSRAAGTEAALLDT
jgi:peptidoglycan/LPS O-acetylase OafA/YrhL